MDWAIVICQGDFSSGLLVASTPNLADSPSLSCLKFTEISSVGGVRKGGAATFTHCGRW